MVRLLVIWILCLQGNSALAAFSSAKLEAAYGEYAEARKRNSESSILNSYRRLLLAYDDVIGDKIPAVPNFDLEKFVNFFDGDALDLIGHRLQSRFQHLEYEAFHEFDRQLLLEHAKSDTRFHIPKNHPDYLTMTYESAQVLAKNAESLLARIQDFNEVSKFELPFGDPSFVYYTSNTLEAVENLGRQPFSKNHRSWRAREGKGRYGASIDLWHYLGHAPRSASRWHPEAKRVLKKFADKTLVLLKLGQESAGLIKDIPTLEFNVMAALMEPLIDRSHPSSLVPLIEELDQLQKTDVVHDDAYWTRLHEILFLELHENPRRLAFISLVDQVLRRWDILFSHGLWLAEHKITGKVDVKKLMPGELPEIHLKLLNNFRTYIERKSVANSITIGGARGAKLNIILGPTGRGKSTLVRSIGQALYLSLIGLSSPAASTKVQPQGLYFFKLPNVDDPSESMSLFMTQVQEQLSFIKKLKAPALVVFDDTDPNASLDIRFALQKALYDRLLAEPGISILVITHSVEVAEAYHHERAAGKWTPQDVQIFHLSKYRLKKGFNSQVNERREAAEKIILKHGGDLALLNAFQSAHRQFVAMKSKQKCAVVLERIKDKL